MEKTKKELFLYSVKILERGDGYRAVQNYLKRYTSDEDLVKDIIEKLNQLEKEGQIKQPKKKEVKGSITNKVLGVFFLLLGGLSLIFLWQRGFVATISFVLIGIGFWALFSKKI